MHKKLILLWALILTACIPTPTPTDSQPQQQSSSTQSPLSKYDYTLAFAAITVAMVTLATGYVLRKRKITTSSVFSPKS